MAGGEGGGTRSVSAEAEGYRLIHYTETAPTSSSTSKIHHQTVYPVNFVTRLKPATYDYNNLSQSVSLTNNLI